MSAARPQLRSKGRLGHARTERTSRAAERGAGFETLPDGKGRHLPWRGRTAGFALSPRVGQRGAGQHGDQDAGDDRFSPEVDLHEPLPAPAAREPPIGPSRSSCQPLTWSPHGFRSLGAVRATSTV